MNIVIDQATSRAERLKINHRMYARKSARKRYHQNRTKKWEEALAYLLTLEGDLPELADKMAEKYNISKRKC